MMINQHLSILVDQLHAEGIDDPLAQSFTLAALWDDLAAIVGEPSPAAVRAILGDTQRPQIAPYDGAPALPALSHQRGNVE